jgi:hypothetical protein
MNGVCPASVERRAIVQSCSSTQICNRIEDSKSKHNTMLPILGGEQQPRVVQHLYRQHAPAPLLFPLCPCHPSIHSSIHSSIHLSIHPSIQPYSIHALPLQKHSAAASGLAFHEPWSVLTLLMAITIAGEGSKSAKGSNLLGKIFGRKESGLDADSPRNVSSSPARAGGQLTAPTSTTADHATKSSWNISPRQPGLAVTTGTTLQPLNNKVRKPA